VINGIPRSDVVAIVSENGGKLVGVQEDRLAREDWRSYTYFVTK
jgi:hypothetical protein